ncbi:MAG: septal ring lytic transglycosylase RlpA family protein [Flexistipes sinusarabici]|uniref:Probable endolytic peptidoglycan transglycosylase RlpA n=1 Tax=Flexistipes sinusarabici TaxID=2352 RepID=A0A5D0MQ28_FLESI|nr:septal ring lytic transglycosylase RlpA family protein [Flexistipes sinusarabici]TYB33701.1 MAG: septal ring lytic transglycosylase RlpA family protein [Flexistipes sinusarabici]
MKKLLLLSLTALILISCGTKVQQIPPSADYKDVAYGKPYIIRGIKYYPMSYVSDFEQVGYASWYGTEEHGTPTANGEIYDMYANTAAHKTLPLGSMVHVENLENGRTTVVKINDRGPFIKGRIIDLSYTGAKKIGIVDKGVAKVKITLLSEAKDRLVVDGRDVNLAERKFAVQIGSFTVYENAKRLAEKHNSAGITKFRKNGSTFYRVRIRNFGNRDEAENFIDEYSIQYPDAFIVAQD